MEVENGVLEDVWLVSKWAIFHFHDYGRKGMQCFFLNGWDEPREFVASWSGEFLQGVCRCVAGVGYGENNPKAFYFQIDSLNSSCWEIFQSCRRQGMEAYCLGAW